MNKNLLTVIVISGYYAFIGLTVYAFDLFQSNRHMCRSTLVTKKAGPSGMASER